MVRPRDTRLLHAPRSALVDAMLFAADAVSLVLTPIAGYAVASAASAEVTGDLLLEDGSAHAPAARI